MHSDNLAEVAANKFIHLTTRGRYTGRPHTVELWFAIADGSVYLSHEGLETDWMKNIAKNPEASFEIAGKMFQGKGRYLRASTEEEWVAKKALYQKYYRRAERKVIEDWFSLSKLLAIDLI